MKNPQSEFFTFFKIGLSVRPITTNQSSCPKDNLAKPELKSHLTISVSLMRLNISPPERGGGRGRGERDTCVKS